MSTRNDILTHLVTYLDAATTANVYLRRVTDIAPAQLPAVLVVPGRSPVRVVAGGVLEHSLEVAVVILSQGATAMSAAETIAAALLAAISSNRTMGSHATDTTWTDIAEEKEQSDQARCALSLQLTIRYETALWGF
jgi:hypothetical protein